MWPWGHFAVGYIAYSILARIARDRAPSASSTIALAFGTQFPDIVDKPLAWWVGVLPNGRSLAHSLLTFGLVLSILTGTVRDRNRRRFVVPFGLGYLSHLLADGVGPAVAGEIHSLGYLFWPVVPAIEYSTEQSFLAHLGGLSFTPFAVFELLLTVSAIGLWVHDGLPGLSTGLGTIRRLRE